MFLVILVKLVSKAGRKRQNMKENFVYDSLLAQVILWHKEREREKESTGRISKMVPMAASNSPNTC